MSKNKTLLLIWGIFFFFLQNFRFKSNIIGSGLYRDPGVFYSFFLQFVTLIDLS